MNKKMIKLPLEENNSTWWVQFNKCNKMKNCNCSEVLNRFNKTEIFGDEKVPEHFKAKIINKDYLAVSWHDNIVKEKNNQTNINLQILRILKKDKLIPIYQKEITLTTIDDRINVESIYELYEVDDNVMVTVDQKTMKGYFIDFH